MTLERDIMLVFRDEFIKSVTGVDDTLSGRDSSVGRAVDCNATGPGFNTHSTWLGVESAFHPSMGR